MSEQQAAVAKSKMPKELKAKWLEALRSGKYPQGWTCLFDGHGYCCLGVLQAVVDGRVEMIEDESLKYPSSQWSVDHRCSSDDSDVVVNRGFDPVVRFGAGEYDRVSHLNDQGTSFDRIADLIEEQVEGV